MRDMLYGDYENDSQWKLNWDMYEVRNLLGKARYFRISVGMTMSIQEYLNERDEPWKDNGDIQKSIRCKREPQL